MSDQVIGREPELAAGERFLEALTTGAAALLIRGEPGIGKTVLWQAITTRATERGYRILSCRLGASETSLAFAGLTDLLSDVDDELFDVLPAPQRKAVDAALLRGETVDGAPDPRAVATGFLTALKLLAENAPVVLAIDDAQWLDLPSANALGFVARRLSTLLVGVLASTRPTSGPTQAFAQALPAAQVFESDVGPMSTAGLYRLIVDRVGIALPRPLLRRVESASAGNPFYALQIARALAEKALPSPQDPLPVPDDLLAILAEQIAELPPRARDAVLTVSALSRPTTDLVAADSLEPARRAGIVVLRGDGHVEFAHPLFAAAAYAAASPERRRSLHRDLADLAVDVEERARHLVRATTGPDENVANSLHEAADRAAQRGAPEVAAELEEEAARRTPSPPSGVSWERLLRAAEHYIQAGDGDRARQLGEEVIAESPPSTIRADALHLLAETCYRDRLGNAITLLQEALACVEDDPSRAVQIEHSLAFVAMATGNMVDFDRRTRHVAEVSESLGETAVQAEALGLVAMCDFFMARGFDEPTIQRALVLEDHERRVPLQIRPTMHAAILYEFTAQFDRARELLIGLRDRIVERGEESDLPFLLIHLSGTDLFSGDLAAAETHASEAVEAADLVESQVLRGFALAARALARTHRGDAAARDDALESIDICTHVDLVHGAAAACWALGILALQQDDPHRALDALAPVVAGIETTDLYDWASAMYLPDALEALIATGEISRAERLTDSLADTGRRLDRPWALATSGRCRALLEAARGNLDTALVAVEAALVEHERLPMPLERGRTLLVQGQILRRTRRKRAARESLEEALAIFEGIGAMLWAEKARAELSRIGFRPAAPDELTETERRVAELTASGLTNREVAAQAFLTPKSVEDVLARVYRKLDIHSRAELGAKIASGARD